MRAASTVLGKPLPYDTLEAVRARLEAANPVFSRIGQLPRFGCSDHSGPAGDPAVLGEAPFVSPVSNYYQTDPISRASATMAECAAVYQPALLIAAE